MTDNDGPPSGGEAEPAADRQAIAASMMNSAEWQKKLAAAREARAKVLAARTSDPEEKLKAALARTAATQETRNDPPASPAQPAEAFPDPAPHPPTQTTVMSAEPQLAAAAPPVDGLTYAAPGAASEPRPRRKIPGFLIGLLIGLCLGAIALAGLWLANPKNRSAVGLHGALSQTLDASPKLATQARSAALLGRLDHVSWG